jgi:hypothetical protein
LNAAVDPWRLKGRLVSFYPFDTDALPGVVSKFAFKMVSPFAAATSGETAIKAAWGAICDAAPRLVTVHVLIREKALSLLPSSLAEGRPMEELRAAGLDVSNTTQLSEARLQNKKKEPHPLGEVRLLASIEAADKTTKLTDLLKSLLGDDHELNAGLTPAFPWDPAVGFGEYGTWKGSYEYDQVEVDRVGELPHFSVSSSSQATTAASKDDDGKKKRTKTAPPKGKKTAAAAAAAAAQSSRAAPGVVAVAIMLDAEIPGRGGGSKPTRSAWSRALTEKSNALGGQPYIIVPKPGGAGGSAGATAMDSSDDDEDDDAKEEASRREKKAARRGDPLRGVAAAGIRRGAGAGERPPVGRRGGDDLDQTADVPRWGPCTS